MTTPPCRHRTTGSAFCGAKRDLRVCECARDHVIIAGGNGRALAVEVDDVTRRRAGQRLHPALSDVLAGGPLHRLACRLEAAPGRLDGRQGAADARRFAGIVDEVLRAPLDQDR